MKRIAVVGLILILALTVAVLAGCGDETTETTEAAMQSTTTMMPADTTEMQETTTSTTGPMTTAPETTETTQGTETTGSDMGGVEIPEAMPGAYTDLTPEQAKQLIDTTPDLVILDVSPKYAEGHLPGAINYYIGDGSLEAAIPTLDQSVPYLVYCHVDSASIGGAEALVEAGFPTVYRLEGNYAAWVDAGYPIEK